MKQDSSSLSLIFFLERLVVALRQSDTELSTHSVYKNLMLAPRILQCYRV
jgi:hypothetical protein